MTADNLVDDILPPHPNFTTAGDALALIETVLLPAMGGSVLAALAGRDTAVELALEALTECLQFGIVAVADLASGKGLAQVKKDLDDRLTDLVEQQLLPLG